MADTELARALRANLDALIRDVNTVEELAAKLSNMGHVGPIGGACTCPIAVYLMVAGGFHRVKVDRYRSFAFGPDETWAPAENHYLIREFIRRFDRGDFPELLAYDRTPYDGLAIA